MRNRHNGTQNGTPMVPKMLNGTQNSTQVVPKLSDAFYRMINFHHFWSPKNGSKATLTMILGTILNFWVPLIIFLEHILCKLFKKKTYPITRIIYLPSLELLIFCQIHHFHLWDSLHFLGTIEYSMVPKIFIIVKYEISAF